MDSLRRESQKPLRLSPAKPPSSVARSSMLPKIKGIKTQIRNDFSDLQKLQEELSVKPNLTPREESTLANIIKIKDKRQRRHNAYQRLVESHNPPEYGSEEGRISLDTGDLPTSVLIKRMQDNENPAERKRLGGLLTEYRIDNLPEKNKKIATRLINQLIETEDEAKRGEIAEKLNKQ